MNQHSKPIILIATIGSSPAVLTEALYALHQRHLWPVAEVKIITTRHGKDRLNRELFSTEPRGGYFLLCDELGISPLDMIIPSGDRIDVVTDSGGKPLEDIRTSEDDHRLAEHTQEVVRACCNDHNFRVFALLAGGRKTMTSHLASSMQLFGRHEDRLFHILVSEPYEKIPGFCFPTKARKLVDVPEHMHKELGLTKVDFSEAKIDLIEIPFLKLRDYVQDHINYSHSFSEILARTDELLLLKSKHPVRSLVVDLVNKGIMINGKENFIQLAPRQLAIFALFAWMNLRNGEPRDITWSEVINSEKYLEIMHMMFRNIQYSNLHGIADTEEREAKERHAREKDDWSVGSNWTGNGGKKIFEANNFSRHRTELKKSIALFLKQHMTGPIKPEHIFFYNTTYRDTLESPNRVPVPVDHISFTGHDENALLELN